VTQAKSPAKELEQAFEKATGTKASPPLDATARKLARALLVAQVAVTGLSRDDARRVRAHLDLTTLDPLQAPSLVQVNAARFDGARFARGSAPRGILSR
jgi:hypothetical protein